MAALAEQNKDEIAAIILEPVGRRAYGARAAPIVDVCLTGVHNERYGAHIVKADIGRVPGAAETYKIRSTPTTVVIARPRQKTSKKARKKIGGPKKAGASGKVGKKTSGKVAKASGKISRKTGKKIDTSKLAEMAKKRRAKRFGR